MRTVIWCMAVLAVTSMTPSAAAQEPRTPKEAILQAMKLPDATREARVLGVPELDIQMILGTAREQRIPAGVLTEVIVTQNEAVREHGPVENFGAFVQSRLKQGLRGRELAAAIRAEHAARGIGRGKRLPGAPEHAGGQGKGAAKASAKAGERGGRPADAGKPVETGEKAGGGGPDEAGRSEAHGKPDSPGKKGGK